VHKIFMPRLGQTMEEGVLIGWHVETQRAYDAGEVLYEVETDKTTTQVEATLPGRLIRLLAEPDFTYPVGAVIAVAADGNEQPTDTDIDAFLAGEEEGATTAAARQPIREDATADAVIQARGMAARRAPLNATHRRMADRVSASWREIPQFTQTVTVDASTWDDRRHRVSDNESDVRVTVTDIVLDALIRATEEVPEVNSTYTPDALILWDDVNVSLAVATPDGLKVPVLRGAQRLSIVERATRLRELVARARRNETTIDEVDAGTITLSNLGMLGIDSGTPLVTSPQVAIVFVGATRPMVVPRDGALEIRPCCVIATSFDHRAVDGAMAAALH